MKLAFDNLDGYLPLRGKSRMQRHHEIATAQHKVTNQRYSKEIRCRRFAMSDKNDYNNAKRDGSIIDAMKDADEMEARGRERIGLEDFRRQAMALRRFRELQRQGRA